MKISDPVFDRQPDRPFLEILRRYQVMITYLLSTVTLTGQILFLLQIVFYPYALVNTQVDICLPPR